MNDRFVTGSVVAMVTPFEAGGRTPDERAWRGLLRWHVEAGTAGVVVAGTTGESATLTGDERDRLLEWTADEIGGRLRVIAGTGSAATAAAVAQSRRAARLGAEAVLVVTPYYNRPPQRGLAAHYRAIADASDVPVILYNVPARTAVDLEPETVLALAEHPNIVGIKEAVADMDRVARYAGAGLDVLSGDDPSACRAMQHGALGVISVAANVAPAVMARLCDRALAGDRRGAEAVNADLEALYGFLAAEPNPIPVKWMLSETGRIGSDLRLPLVSLDARHQERGRELLESLAGA